MTDLKNEIIEKYDVRPSTAKRMLDILNIVDEISKVEYGYGNAVAYAGKDIRHMKGPNAEQMFKDLGYSILINDEYEICYHNDKTGDGVKFSYEDLKFYLQNSDRSIDMPLLNAINQ